MRQLTRQRAQDSSTAESWVRCRSCFRAHRAEKGADEMAHVEGEIIINRPVEEVFDFVADERNEPHYNA